jgi:hypothetical protein
MGKKDSKKQQQEEDDDNGVTFEHQKDLDDDEAAL